MNTLPLDVRPANPINVPANDTSAIDWTAHPLARRIVASFATTPPPVTTIPRHERWDYRDTAYTGFRVQCLRVIRSSVIEPAFKSAHAAGRLDDAAEIANAISVEDAVERALRIPALRAVTTAARQLDPAIWGAAL